MLTSKVTFPEGLVEPVIVTGVEALGRGHDYNKLVQFAQIILITAFVINTSLFATNNALDFDGSNDYVSISDNAALDLTTNYTIEAWIKADALVSQGIVAKYQANSDDGYTLSLLNSLGKISFDGTTTSEGSITAGIWYHIAAVNDAGTRHVYVNGIDLSLSGTPQTTVSNSVPVTIGNGYVADDPEGQLKYFNGLIDDVRIWDDVRTVAEIRTNMYQELTGNENGLVAYFPFNETSGTSTNDSQSSSNHDGTLTNMVGSEWTTSSAIFGPKHALNFDGTDDYVNLGNTDEFDNLSLTDFTMEMWVKTTRTDRSILIGNHDGNPSYSFEIFRGGKLRTYLNGTNHLDDVSVADGNWHHVATTVDFSGNVTMYIDGKESYSAAVGETAYSVDRDLMVGRDPRPISYYFDGSMDEIRIWSDVRTAAEIRENMSRPLVGDEVNLLVYYNINSSMGATLQDFSSNALDGTRYGGETGTSTAYTTMRITDSGENWTHQALKGKTVKITTSGKEQEWIIEWNGADAFDIHGSFDPALDANVDYEIIDNDDWVASTAFNTWLNTNSATWSTASNWSDGVPVSTDNVSIPDYTSGTAPALSGTPTVNHLFIGSTSDLTLTSNATVNGNFILFDDLDLNGQTITLGSAAHLYESGGNISGTSGTIQTTRDLSNIDQDVAGLGAEITEDGDLGSTTIIRGHEAQGSQGITRYYQISTANAPTSATLVFNYLDAELNGLNESSLELFKSADGDSWTEQSSSTVNTSNNTLTLTGINSFSWWTGGKSGADGSLPVELSSWTATSKSGIVNLEWTTDSEIENLGFIIERASKSSATGWEELASFSSHESLKGQGSTTRTTEYQFTDKTVQIGQTYTYRLSDVDYHGNQIYHTLISILVTAVDETMLVDQFTLAPAYPNPFNPSTMIRYGLPKDSKMSLIIYDIRGTEINTLASGTQAAGWHEISWNGHKANGQPISTGVYFARLVAGNYSEVIKLLYLE
jgi:hypothetical protein